MKYEGVVTELPKRSVRVIAMCNAARKSGVVTCPIQSDCTDCKDTDCLIRDICSALSAEGYDTQDVTRERFATAMARELLTAVDRALPSPEITEFLSDDAKIIVETVIKSTSHLLVKYGLSDDEFLKLKGGHRWTGKGGIK